jgi:hypothetical protein
MMVKRPGLTLAQDQKMRERLLGAQILGICGRRVEGVEWMWSALFSYLFIIFKLTLFNLDGGLVTPGLALLHSTDRTSQTVATATSVPVCRLGGFPQARNYPAIPHRPQRFPTILGYPSGPQQSPAIPSHLQAGRTSPPHPYISRLHSSSSRDPCLLTRQIIQRLKTSSAACRPRPHPPSLHVPSHVLGRP